MVYLEWIGNIVPGGAGGVALKSRLQWIYAWADSLGFTIELRKGFRVMAAYGMRQSHSDARNLGSVIAKPDKKYISRFW